MNVGTSKTLLDASSKCIGQYSVKLLILNREQKHKLESTNFTLTTQNDLIKDVVETRLVNIEDKIQEEEKMSSCFGGFGTEMASCYKGN